MGKRLELIPNQRLITSKGIETSFIFLSDVELKRYGRTVRRIIKVQCNCGRTKEVQLNNVTGGHSVCCGFSPCKLPFNKNKRSKQTSYNLLYSSYKRGAIGRNLDFDLTIEEFKSFTIKNCYYCNSEPSNIYQVKNSKTGEIRAGIPILYNGIDRLDNNKGYIKDNCIPCCGVCNRMKHAHDYNFFINHIVKIYEFKVNKYGQSVNTL
jgi:hypothetical protein